MKLKVLLGKNQKVYKENDYDVASPTLLLHVLQEHGYLLHAVCGGNASCGKCLVEVKGKGMVYACKTMIEDDMVVCLEQEAPFQILSASESEQSIVYSMEKAGIAIDIGTTTLAYALLDMESQQIVASHAAINHQISFGADVISRIQNANQGKGELLRKSIQKDLIEGITVLLKRCHLRMEQVEQVVLAGNTSMCHFLLGYPCESLGKAPFRPYSVETKRGELGSLLDWKEGKDTPYILFPGITAFVGGDIVSGMYGCDFDSAKAPSLFVDIGTNGEMALLSEKGICVTSAAAGPAFEGGNISCGTGSMEGAISDIYIYKASQLYQNAKAHLGSMVRRYFVDEYVVEVQTIMNGEPIGICGTGMVALLSELRRNQIVDEKGVLHKRYREHGFTVAYTQRNVPIRITQKDIREFQMAKSAIRAGINCLLSSCEKTMEDLKQVFLAGGFGCYLDIHKAVNIGLLPKETEGKIISLGNASLNGTIHYLWKEKEDNEPERFVSKCREIVLATEPDFAAHYLKYMDI